jgi:uncharacterized protein (TIGR02453 family)
MAFTSKTLSFLRSLKRNNTREWFHAHRDEFDAHCRQPMIAIVERLAVDLGRAAPELVIDPKASLFRQFRDTRFSEDKSPMKTNIAATFPNRQLGRMNGAGLYFEVAPGWVWIGGGIYAPETWQLQLVREKIAAHPRRLRAIVESPAVKKLGGLQGERLTRVPRGFAKDHPAAAYLMQKQFLAYREEPAAFATTPHFYRDLLGTFKALVPLLRYLNEPLIEAGRTDRQAHILSDQRLGARK